MRHRSALLMIALIAASMVLMQLVPSYALGADGETPEGPGIPPEGWSRETMLCEYSRLTGAFSAGISGRTVLIAYSDGEYDWLRVVARAFELTKDGPKLLWQKDVSGQLTHNITPTVVRAEAGGFHILWVERPDQDNYSIRYSKLGMDGTAEIGDTLLETAGGPIRDITAAELEDGSLAIAWSDWRGRTLEIIKGRVSFEGGTARLAGLSNLARVQADKAMSNPRIAYERVEGDLALVWVESGFEEANIYAAALDPESLEVLRSEALGSFTTASGGYPAIAAGEPGAIYVSWPQDINIKSLTAIRTSDIMMAKLEDGLMSWSGKIVELPENQTAPWVAFDGEEPFVVWHDYSERSPHTWAIRPFADDAAYRLDYSLMAGMRPVALMTDDGLAAVIYERFTGDGPRQAFLMSQVNPAVKTPLYTMGIDEASPARHVAFTMALSFLYAGMNVMVNIGALMLGMGFLWLIKRVGIKDGMRDKPELMAAAIILFLMLLQATPLFVSLPDIYGADFHIIASLAAAAGAFLLMRLGRSEWWLDSLMQLVFMCVWLFFQQYALLIPGILKVGLR